MLTALVTRLAIAGAYLVTLLFPAPLDTIAALIAVAAVVLWARAVLIARRSTSTTQEKSIRMVG